MSDEEKMFEGTWAMVSVPGGKYLGRIRKVTYDSNNDHDQICAECEPSPDTCLMALMHGGVFTLNPSYDYIMNIQMSHQGGVVKNPITLPLDATLEDTPIHCIPTSLLFFKDMQERDLRGYKDFVTGCIELVKNAKREAAEPPRIIRPDGGIPPGVLPFRKG